MNETTEAEVLPPEEMAVAKHESPPMPVATTGKAAMTTAQAKIDAVAALTLKAYDRASTLTLTQEESAALQKPFADSDFLAGAGGDPNLIYIQHSAIRDRLNSVLGMGQWSLVQHNRWAEQFDFYNKKSGKTEQATRVFVEAMLLVRGCFVAQAVGDHVYYQNDRTNYSDALEAAKTASLRRCCKEFGIGLQAWDRSWCEGWWARKHQRVAFKPEHAPAEDKSYPATNYPPPKRTEAAHDDGQPPGDKVAVTVLRMSKKEGKSAKTGKPWTLHGVLMLFASDGKEHWANTFSDTIAQAAEVLIGQPALATTAPGRGDSLDLLAIEPAQDDVPM